MYKFIEYIQICAEIIVLTSTIEKNQLKKAINSTLNQNTLLVKKFEKCI